MAEPFFQHSGWTGNAAIKKCEVVCGCVGFDIELILFCFLIVNLFNFCMQNEQFIDINRVMTVSDKAQEI